MLQLYTKACTPRLEGIHVRGRFLPRIQQGLLIPLAGRTPLRFGFECIILRVGLILAAVFRRRRPKGHQLGLCIPVVCDSRGHAKESQTNASFHLQPLPGCYLGGLAGSCLGPEVAWSWVMLGFELGKAVVVSCQWSVRFLPQIRESANRETRGVPGSVPGRSELVSGRLRNWFGAFCCCCTAFLGVG